MLTDYRLLSRLRTQTLAFIERIIFEEKSAIIIEYLIPKLFGAIDEGCIDQEVMFAIDSILLSQFMSYDEPKSKTKSIGSYELDTMRRQMSHKLLYMRVL